jgi:tRNA U34 5-carboxymethylaminomethyl modifying enzyme MnmG/GidA
MKSKQDKIAALQPEIREERLAVLDQLIRKVRKADEMKLPTNVNLKALGEIREKGETRLYKTEAETLVSIMRSHGIECYSVTVFRSVDPFSYWLGDEISCYRDVVLKLT